MASAIARIRQCLSAPCGADEAAVRALQQRCAAVLDELEAAAHAESAELAELMERSHERAEASAAVVRHQDEVLATVSHELRNPLSTIATGLEALLHQPHTALVLSGDRTFRIVRHQVSHMTRLLDDLLEARRDAGMWLELSLRSVAIASLAEQAVLAVEERVRRRQQQLTMQVPSQEIRVRVDPGRLQQVLVNLLDNASKYTDDGGRLGLQVEADERTCIVRVWDEGIGIDCDEHDRVRKMFTRGHAQSDRHAPGLGIGLGLATRIVELHGGELEIISRGQGRTRGTEVVVRLVRECVR